MQKYYFKYYMFISIIIGVIFSATTYGAMECLLKGQIEKGKVPDFANKNHYGIIKGGVRSTKNALLFNGKDAIVSLNNSEDLNINDGASYVAIVKFSDVSKDAYDIVMFKKDQFVFSKKGEIFYCNFFNGKKWCAKLYSPQNIKLVANQWYHVVLTFRHYVHASAGEDWTGVKLYIDGRCIAGIQRDHMFPADSEAPIKIGDGFSDQWRLNGAIGEIRMYNKTLSTPEIEKLFEEQQFVKPTFNTPLKLSPKKLEILEQLRTIAADSSEKSRTSRVLISALETIGKIRNSDINFEDYAKQLKQAIEKSKDATQLLKKWNSIGEIRTINTKDVFLTFIYNSKSQKFIFVNLYDYRTARNIFKVGSELWKVNIERSGKKYLFNSLMPNLQAQFIEEPIKEDDCWRFKLKWTHPYFIVQSQFVLNGKRLEYDLNATGSSSTCLIKEVVFPSMKMEQLKCGKDTLLIPKMSGVEHSDPVNKNTSYSNTYPSNYATMQMGAYYDTEGGVYFATEDIRAQTKLISFVSGNKGIDVEYLWNVGFKPGYKNSFAPRCKAVFELMQGNWYDAGLIYRRFLSDSKPVWWTENLPRKDTPAWFRNNSLWIRQWLRKADFKKLEKKTYAAREYFEMPFAMHWYSWHGEHDQDYPHYDICPEFHDLMKRLQSKDIKIIPYVNGRLWDTKDRGDEDWQYSKLALPATAKDEKGEVYTSVFKKRLFAIMCPYTQVWQKQLLEVTDKVLDLGFNGLYWDQVAGASPVLCYDKTHGHLLGDCDLWFMKGNYKVFSQTRALSKKKYSEAAFFSEDNAEPYSKVFDGALCWRWMIKTQVPLFQLIYSGRVQFIGLHYAHGCEDKNARYSKTAKQLVYSEQIGWFTIEDLCASSKDYLLFLKKTIHARQAMLKFFNEGMMQRPIKFLKEMEVFSRKWGIYQTHYVNSPEIASCAWKYKNTIAYLMVNTIGKKVDQKIAFDSSDYDIKAKNVQVHRFNSNGKFENFEINGKFEKELSFAPYSIQLWILSPMGEEPQDIIDNANKIFKKISTFSIPSHPF